MGFFDFNLLLKHDSFPVCLLLLESSIILQNILKIGERMVPGTLIFSAARLAIFFGYYVVGCIYYSRVEGWDITTCVYFTTVTVTTVGYGYYYPTTDNSRLFTVFFILFGLVTVLPAVCDLVHYSIVRFQDRAATAIIPKASLTVKVMFKVGICLILQLIAIFMGTVFFAVNEKWTAATAFYWTIVTMTSVGYGDFVLKESSRQFSIFFIMFSTVTFITSAQIVYENYSIIMSALSRGASATMVSYTRRHLDPEYERSLGSSIEPIPDSMDCTEFVLEALLRTNKINPDAHLTPLIHFLRSCPDAMNHNRLSKMDLERYLSNDNHLSSPNSRISPHNNIQGGYSVDEDETAL